MPSYFLKCSEVIYFLKTRFSCIKMLIFLYGREQFKKFLLQTDQHSRLYQSVHLYAYSPSNRFMTYFQMSFLLEKIIVFFFMKNLLPEKLEMQFIRLCFP